MRKPRLAHEGGREGEGRAVAIEPGEHDLAAGREPRDQRVQDAGVAGGVVDGAVVAPRVVGRVEHRVAERARRRGRVALPHDRRAALRARPSRASSRPSTPWPTISSGVASPAMACCAVAARASSTPRSPSASPIGSARAPGTTSREAARAEQAVHRAEAARAGHEHALAGALRRRRCGRPIRSRGPADSPCRETAASRRSRAGARCRC